ncbi:MAG: CRISPR-associated endonuclease Cas2 [Promethearchaeia archaeon]|nr:MAG: CRISPR-associated endonuclease Cas2 [Candidatus Lokiarchaeia archaeon]
MYVIIVYDISVERVSKVCQFLRQFLNWIQNSVFEGELTKSEIARVKKGINEIINKENDSVIIYIIHTEDALKKETIGIKKAEPCNII